MRSHVCCRYVACVALYLGKVAYVLHVCCRVCCVYFVLRVYRMHTGCRLGAMWRPLHESGELSPGSMWTGPGPMWTGPGPMWTGRPLGSARHSGRSIHIHACVYKCLFMCPFACLHKCIRTCLRTCLHTFLRTYTNIFPHACTHAYTPVFLHVYASVCTHVGTHVKVMSVHIVVHMSQHMSVHMSVHKCSTEDGGTVWRRGCGDVHKRRGLRQRRAGLTLRPLKT